MWGPSYVGITGNEKPDKTAYISTRTILHPKITDISDNKKYKNLHYTKTV